MRVVTWIACGTWLCTFGAGISIGTFLDHQNLKRERSVDAETRMAVTRVMATGLATVIENPDSDVRTQLDRYRTEDPRIVSVEVYRPFHGSLQRLANSNEPGLALRDTPPNSQEKFAETWSDGTVRTQTPIFSATEQQPSILRATWAAAAPTSLLWLWLPISTLLAAGAAFLAHLSVGRKIQELVDDRAVDSLDTLLDQSRSMAAELRRLEESLDERVLVRTRELELENKYKDEQVANTVHELRTPLTTVMASVDMLRQGYATTKEDRDMFLDQARVGSQHLMFLINDILDAAAHDAGKLRIQMQNYFVHDLLEDAHKLMNPVAVFRDMVLKCDVPSQVRAIYIDPGRTLQVIFNLVGNALKYAPDRSKVILRAIYEDEDVIIEVEDEGIGVPLESQNVLFQKFRRLHSPESSSATGTGIGLYLSKVLIEEMLGTIGHRERKEGTGSIFWFRFKPHPKLAAVPEAALEPNRQPSDPD